MIRIILFLVLIALAAKISINFSENLGVVSLSLLFIDISLPGY